MPLVSSQSLSGLRLNTIDLKGRKIQREELWSRHQEGLVQPTSSSDVLALL